MAQRTRIAIAGDGGEAARGQKPDYDRIIDALWRRERRARGLAKARTTAGAQPAGSNTASIAE
jgi:hypothetical protein